MLLLGGFDLLPDQIAQFFCEQLFDLDWLPAGLQASGGFLEQQVNIIQGDAALVVNIQRVEDAVERLEAPGMLTVGLGGCLESAFLVLAQEDTGGSAEMVGIGDDGGVHHLAAESVVIGLFLAVKPGRRTLVVLFHIGSDLNGVVEDILGVEFIHPGAVYAASGVTFRPIAAFDFDGFIQPGVEVESV